MSDVKHATHLDFFLLGTFRIERNAQSIVLSTRKVESLLAFLLLHPHPHPREKLATLFWGDTLDDQARISLRVALSTLRRELGDDILLADRETIQLNPQIPFCLDVAEFCRLVNDDPQSALELYRGDLMPDFYDEWILQEREQFAALYLDARLRLIQLARSEGRYHRAIELANQILATDRANEKAHQHLIFCYLALGNRTAALKQSDECKRALRDGLNVEPSAETLALVARAQASDASAKSPEALFTNLPTPLTSFVGREKELKELYELVGNARLVTLVGAGGCGKTRLAIQVATELAAAEKFRDGVWWIELAALADSALVTPTVAMVFNVSESSAIPLIAVLTNFMRGKELLLVLDNCEHLLSGCAQLVGTLLSACPRLRVMVTSREPLNLSSETTWRVPSLALPDGAHIPPLAQLRQYDAIQLFSERALAVQKNWRLAGNGLPVAQICARLDGIPLAIELAAAQLRNFSAEHIAARLDDRFDLLANNTRAALQRHQTLRATMDWSYDLLLDVERALLCKLSVFAGSFTFEAVESITSQLNTEQGTRNTLDVLTLLADKSLVVIETHGNATRYRLLETVRQYAREKLIQAHQAEQTQVRHRDYFVEWIEQAAPHLRRADAIEWRDRIAWDHDNLRAAFEHAISSDAHIALRIAWGLRQYWSWRGLVPEGLVWVNRLLPMSETWGNTGGRARVLTLQAFLYRMQWNIPMALPIITQAVEMARAANEPRDLGFALLEAAYLHQFPIPPNCTLAIAYFDEGRKIFETLGDSTLREWIDLIQGMAIAGAGDLPRGMAQMQASLERCRASGDKLGVMDALGGLGYISLIIGDYVNATKYNGEVVALGREVGITIEFVQMLTLYTACLIKLGDFRQALLCAQQVMRLYHDQASIPGIVIGLEMIGMCLAASKKFAPAVGLFGNVERERESKRSTTFVVPDFFAPEWANVRAQMGDAAYLQANAEGRAMELEQAYEYAMENAKLIL